MEGGYRMSNEFRNFTKRLVNNGYKRTRIRGSHYIFENEAGNTIVVNKDINRMVKARLIKENHLV